MKKQINEGRSKWFVARWLPLLMLGLSAPAFGAEAMESPAADMQAAGKALEQAGQDFSDAASASQRTGQTSWSSASSVPPVSQGRQNDPRADAMQGSPETGYAGTWTDPATGDIITSVIAPTPPKNPAQDYPVIVEPQVSSSGWGGNGGWNNGNGWNGSQGWPQWPGYPGNNEYPPQPQMPNAANGFRPLPPPPQTPDLSHRPGWPQQPGYRPLRPRPPQNPGQSWTHGPGYWPGAGFNPPPAGNNPGSLWRPGQNMPQRPPVNGQLPMRPGGGSWGQGAGSSWGSGGWGQNAGNWGSAPGRPQVQPRGGF